MKVIYNQAAKEDKNIHQLLINPEKNYLKKKNQRIRRETYHHQVIKNFMLKFLKVLIISIMNKVINIIPFYNNNNNYKIIEHKNDQEEDMMEIENNSFLDFNTNSGGTI